MSLERMQWTDINAKRVRQFLLDQFRKKVFNLFNSEKEHFDILKYFSDDFNAIL